MEIEKLISPNIVETEGKKKLSCKAAHEIAEKYNITLKEIGRFCEKEKIKIYSCELGCF